MDKEKYRDKIATVDEKGRRIWIYPKKPKGKFYNARTYVSWVLLVFLFAMPFIKVKGEPILLFNVLERKFIIFGLLFSPQDFHLFVLAMLTFIVFIVLFTVIFGRLFCGWVCPQTIFMEMVFRKIEYWIEGDANAQKRLDKAPWTRDKIIKKTSKHLLFFAIAVLIANTFLSYIIGVDEVIKIVSEPLSLHLTGFISMLLFSAAFYGVFAKMREQVCTTICPYGRLQGVLTDKNTILVSYDFERGRTKRERFAKSDNSKLKTNPIAAIQNSITTAVDLPQYNPSFAEEKPIKLNGDCIDCKLCVKVCPTGIDIRDGAQLECVNCTACMDACDGVMEKVKRPKGLIRYDSYKGIVEKRKSIFTTRVIAYSAVLAILLAVNVILLGSRSDVETLIFRTPGMLYQKVDDTYISNLYNYQIFNKTLEEFPVEFKIKNEEGRIKWVGSSPVTKESDMVEGAFFIEMDKNKLESRKNKIFIEVYSEEKLLDVVKTTFLGPVK